MGFQETNGVLCVDGVALPDIAARFGTPAYVYSADVIKSQFENLSGAMKKHLPAKRQPMLCFACKAASNIGILSYLRSLGSGLEIVSGGELVRGLKAGFAPNTIVFTGVGKTRDEITAALKAGIHQFNVESLPELFHINDVAGGLGITATVVFRLNPHVTGGGHEKITTGRKCDKFGIGADKIDAAFQTARGLNHINAAGLSMHIGSQVSTVESFRAAFEKLPGIVTGLRAQGHAITRLDIGGGFPIIYKDEKLLDLDAYAQWVRDIIAPLGTEIILEPGRYLVGNAGVILTEVLYVKQTADRDFLIVDAAMNDLIRPAMYDAYHAIEPVKNRNAPVKTYDIVGPVCETGDTFARGRALPKMSAGDLAVIKSAGAYGASMASNYNTRPLAPEIMVKDGQIHVLRERQTVEDILSLERSVAWK